MEIDELSKLKEEPHQLSGAYIRSLVKQITSSRTKDTMNHKDLKFREGFSEGENRQQQPQQHKKQVRRRLHTSRPYQERLLNMAEARREIVTALKFHRASMKQAEEEQQEQGQQPRSYPGSEPEGRIKSRRNPRSHPSDSTSYLETLPYSSNFPYQFSRFPAPPLHENFDFVPLPSQTLGLNLNYQGFDNISTTLYHNSSSTSSFHSTSASASSSSSASFSIATDHEVPSSSAAMSHVKVDIRSLGEQHQMEWNDTVNLETSAWWSKFMKAEDDDDLHNVPFDDEVRGEFPTWLSANEGSFQQHLNDYYSSDYFQDPALPCMDIGEFEGFDGEWLA